MFDVLLKDSSWFTRNCSVLVLPRSDDHIIPTLFFLYCSPDGFYIEGGIRYHYSRPDIQDQGHWLRAVILCLGPLPYRCRHKVERLCLCMCIAHLLRPSPYEHTPSRLLYVRRRLPLLLGIGADIAVYG